MRSLIRAITSGLVGYVGGAFVTSLITGGSVSDGVPVTFGYIFALLGWLFGIGVWNSWAREWFGLPPKPDNAQGWTRYFTFSTAHTVLGSQYLVTFLVVFLVGGLMAMIIRLELAGTGEGFIDSDTYNKVMSMHGILMVAVAVVAVLGSFGTYLAPLRIGADDMAFPRINALSFWLIPPVAISLLSAPLLGSFHSV